MYFILCFCNSCKSGLDAPILPVMGLLKKCHTDPFMLPLAINSASLAI